MVPTTLDEAQPRRLVLPQVNYLLELASLSEDMHLYLISNLEGPDLPPALKYLRSEAKRNMEQAQFGRLSLGIDLRVLCCLSRNSRRRIECEEKVKEVLRELLELTKEVKKLISLWEQYLDDPDLRMGWTDSDKVRVILIEYRTRLEELSDGLTDELFE